MSTAGIASITACYWSILPCLWANTAPSPQGTFTSVHPASQVVAMVAESPGRMGKPLCYVLRSNSDTSHHPLQSHCFPTVSDIHQAHSYLTRICMLYLSLLQECFSPNTCTTYFFTSSRSCINVFFSEEVFPDHCVQNGHTSISALLNASCFIFLHPIYHFLNISEAPHHLE